MIRFLKACLMSVAGSLIAGDAIAQAPPSATLTETELSANRPGSGQRDLGQQGQARGPIGPRDQTAQELPASGNPLWEIPLATLTATRERPLFSPSRRPAVPTVAAPLTESAAQPVVEAGEPERPPFTLLGTVMGASENLAIFFSQTSNSVVRRHIGEAESGWVLRLIDVRTTTVEKDTRQVTLALPARRTELVQSEPPRISPQLRDRP
jgi:general secretion pathway protein N